MVILDIDSMIQKDHLLRQIIMCMLTNAGRALFSSNYLVLMKTVVYATETKDTFIKRNHFKGNVFECIDEGIAFIMSAINWNVVINGNSKRNEEPEIPQTAICEMVINAFAHHVIVPTPYLLLKYLRAR